MGFDNVLRKSDDHQRYIMSRDRTLKFVCEVSGTRVYVQRSPR